MDCNWNLDIVVQEMLILAAWAYDLPDMDVAINAGDVQDCGVGNFPVIGYAVTEDRKHQGFTMPTYHMYSDLGMSRQQMEGLQACLIKGNTLNDSKRPAVFWRGGDTGGIWDVHRFSRNLSSARWDELHVYDRVFRKKRVHAVLSSTPYDFMDVKLTKLTSDGARKDNPLRAFKHNIIFGHGLPMAEWNSYAVQLSLDGLGPAFREPLQLLGSSVLLLARSQMDLFYHQLLEPGKHVEVFDEDLSDLVAVSKRLVAEWRRDSTRLSSQVRNMNAFALDHLTLEAQLRSFAWSLLKVRALVPWKTELQDGFAVVKQARTWKNQWIDPELKQQIMRDMAANFENV